MRYIDIASNINFYSNIDNDVGTDRYIPVVYRIWCNSSAPAFHKNDMKFQKLDQKKNISNFKDHLKKIKENELKLKILYHLRKITRENDIKIKKIISFTKNNSRK